MTDKQTTVVHCVKNPKYDVYIGRRNNVWGKAQSLFFNPFCIKDFNSREMVLELYRVYFYKRLEIDPNFKSAVQALRGQVLGCWCDPKPCHGHIIIEYLEQTCPECWGATQSSPDGEPWCPKCEPDAPTHFHVQETQ